MAEYNADSSDQSLSASVSNNVGNVEITNGDIHVEGVHQSEETINIVDSGSSNSSSSSQRRPPTATLPNTDQTTEPETSSSESRENNMSNQANNQPPRDRENTGEGPGEDRGQQQRQPIPENPLVHIRGRLFHAIFCRMAITYARMFPPTVRRIMEFFFLLKALFFLGVLVYLHVSFSYTSCTCLAHLNNTWPKDGILRVEIVRNAPTGYSLKDSYFKEYKKSFDLHDDSDDELDDSGVFLDAFPLKSQKVRDSVHSNESAAMSFSDVVNGDWPEQKDSELVNYTKEANGDFEINFRPYRHTLVGLELLPLLSEVHHIMEYSQEFGFLRLNPDIRRKHNITVHFIVLDPDKDKCLGTGIQSFLLEEFLGYDDILISSFKHLAEIDGNKGFLRNVVNGDHFRFVSMSVGRTSYVAAAAVMMIFTVSVSMLLRYSHQQIFFFIIELLRVLEMNTALVFPAAPLLTVILALVGMEAIMSEFFSDTSTAFYIILIVWVADQFDVICCHSPISKRHWLRFFYLYHVAFYAYHYRFSGQYSGLALFCSWLFIQHSMVYFLHHYDLPMILENTRLHVQGQRVVTIVRQPNATIIRQPRRQQPVQQPVPQPVQQPVPQPVQQPVLQPVQQPVPQPVQQPVQQPVSHPVQQAVQQPAPEPGEQPVQQPVEQSALQTVQSVQEPGEQSEHSQQLTLTETSVPDSITDGNMAVEDLSSNEHPTESVSFGDDSNVLSGSSAEAVEVNCSASQIDSLPDLSSNLVQSDTLTTNTEDRHSAS